MKLENKYIIGTHIMFYEIEMVKEHVQSIVNAIETVDNKKNITVDLNNNCFLDFQFFSSPFGALSFPS